MRFGEVCRLLPNSSPKMIKQQLKLLEDNEIVKNEKKFSIILLRLLIICLKREKI